MSATPRTRESLDDPFSGELLLSRFLVLAIDAEKLLHKPGAARYPDQAVVVLIWKDASVR